MDLSNLTYRETSNWQLIFDKYPEMTFYVKSCPIPGVSIGVMDLPTPYYRMKQPGTSVEFDDVSLSLILDEQLIVYETLFNWMMSLKPLTLNDSTTDTAIKSRIEKYTGDMFSNAKISLFSNNFTEIYKTINIYHLWPNSLSTIDLSNEDTESVVLTFEVIFSYAYFNIS